MSSTDRYQPFFLGAPTTKLLSVAAVIAYVLIHIKNAHSFFAMDTHRIQLQGEWYRLFTAHMTFGSAGELVMGTLVVTHFSRRFERELGSRKFSIWLLQVYLVAIPLIWTVAVMTSLHLHYAGPYPTLGAVLFMFYRYTPRLHPRFFGILGFHVSEKAIPYAFALQVMVSGGIHTLIPTLCGGVAGWLAISYTLDVPDAVANFVSLCASLLVEAPPAILAPRTPRPFNAGAAPRRQRVAAAAPPAQPRAPPPQPPSEAAIDQLTAMGFDRGTVVRALQESNNSVERALDRLLSGN